MRKIICGFICCIFITILLTGCGNCQYSVQQPVENIVRITYVDENAQSEIPKEHIEALVAEIQQLQCKRWYNDPQEVLSIPYIIIYYADGSCEEISAMASYRRTSKNKKFLWVYFDRDEFCEVLEKYARDIKN